MGWNKSVFPMAIVCVASVASAAVHAQQSTTHRPGAYVRPSLAATDTASPSYPGPMFAPEPIMDLSFRPVAAVQSPPPTSLRDNAPTSAIEPAAFTPTKSNAFVDPIETSFKEAAEERRPMPSDPVAPAAKTETPLAPSTNPVAETIAEAVSESKRETRFSLQEIPRSVDGRKSLAKRLLAEAREHLKAGRAEEAEKIVYQLRELALAYNGFEDNPDKLHQDVVKSRSFGKLLFQDIKRL